MPTYPTSRKPSATSGQNSAGLYAIWALTTTRARDPVATTGPPLAGSAGHVHHTRLRLRAVPQPGAITENGHFSGGSERRSSPATLPSTPTSTPR